MRGPAQWKTIDWLSICVVFGIDFVIIVSCAATVLPKG